MTLTAYNKKRDFQKSPEPKGQVPSESKGWRFVIQKHHASHLHYDLRLELDGVLKSWAVPKGPSLDPKVKRLAIHVEDHPIEYADFEGIIPSGYGAGTVIVWDRGHWTPKDETDPGYQRGSMTFTLDGDKLKGEWKLVRTRRAKDDRDHWLFMKVQDKHAKDENTYSITEKKPKSVQSGKTLEQIGGKTPAKKPKSRSISRSKMQSTGIASVALANDIDPSALPGAQLAAWPRKVLPQLATLGSKVPQGDEWEHEIKFDGYRLLAHISAGEVRLMTRSGLDWTGRFQSLVPTLQSLPIERAILDGEVVVLDDKGLSSFQMLQNQLKSKTPLKPEFYLFDLIHCNDHDLALCPLADRKMLLERICRGLSKTSNVHYTEHIVGNGQSVADQACLMGLEGVISKRMDSPYRFARSPDWVKTKCLQRQEFVIVGYTAPKGSRAGFGALLLGVRQNGKMVYSGRVGTGFDDPGLIALHGRLKTLEVDQPSAQVPAALSRDVRWVKPQLVAEVKFTGWTDDGRLRHPVFVGLREDKQASEVVREKPMQVSTSKRKSARRVEIAGVAISHPDRIVYPRVDISKEKLVEYYDAVAHRMLPYVIDRPLVLVRCPQGPAGKCFYQRNLTGTFPPGVVGIEVEEKEGPTTCVAIEDRAGLVALIQMGVLEIHTWGSRGDNPELPDQIIFDLDPAPDVSWEAMVEAAHEIRALLSQLELSSFVKTTGGKGLHIAVPLRRKADWPQVKEFAGAFAGSLARAAPTRFTATMSKAKRVGKIFIDHFRNGRGASAVAPYSTRAKPAATVSAPLSWNELTNAMTNEKHTVITMLERLKKQKVDPWRDFDSARQVLTQARQRAVLNLRRG